MAELEGFLCPLCKQDCRSVLELETHYREAHDQSTASNFKKDFISFFESAFNISPKQQRARAEVAWSRSTSEEGEIVLEPVTNVSGIDTDYWPPQEMGELVRQVDVVTAMTHPHNHRLCQGTHFAVP